MLFPHKTQTVSVATFICAMLLSAIYIALRGLGIEFPHMLSQIIVLSLGLTVCITAVLAPFSKEKTEDETVSSIRVRTASGVMAACFCIIMLHHMLSIILKALDMEALVTGIRLVSLQSVLAVEIIYFIILKTSVRAYLKKR